MRRRNEADIMQRVVQTEKKHWREILVRMCFQWKAAH